MARRETPWLKPDFSEYVDPHGWEWLCAEVVRRFFNVPKRARIKVVVSDKPIPDAIPLYLQGRCLTLKLEEGDQIFVLWGDFEHWLRPGDHWGWIEYEVAA